jgi:hypothetical protein
MYSVKHSVYSRYLISRVQVSHLRNLGIEFERGIRARNEILEAVGKGNSPREQGTEGDRAWGLPPGQAKRREAISRSGEESRLQALVPGEQWLSEARAIGKTANRWISVLLSRKLPRHVFLLIHQSVLSPSGCQGHHTCRAPGASSLPQSLRFHLCYWKP